MLRQWDLPCPQCGNRSLADPWETSSTPTLAPPPAEAENHEGLHRWLQKLHQAESYYNPAYQRCNPCCEFLQIVRMNPSLNRGPDAVISPRVAYSLKLCSGLRRRDSRPPGTPPAPARRGSIRGPGPSASTCRITTASGLAWIYPRTKSYLLARNPRSPPYSTAISVALQRTRMATPSARWPPPSAAVNKRAIRIGTVIN